MSSKKSLSEKIEEVISHYYSTHRFQEHTPAHEIEVRGAVERVLREAVLRLRKILECGGIIDSLDIIEIFGSKLSNGEKLSNG